jgi:hypothetical protein
VTQLYGMYFVLFEFCNSDELATASIKQMGKVHVLVVEFAT